MTSVYGGIFQWIPLTIDSFVYQLIFLTLQVDQEVAIAWLTNCSTCLQKLNFISLIDYIKSIELAIVSICA